MTQTVPPTTLSIPSPDFVAIKARQQATWASGDFAVIGTTLQIVGESLCEAVDLRAGERVLDVACGNGNATLAAARRWGRVTGVDYVPELLSKAQKRATAEALEVELLVGDAESLPFDDGSFDVVLSTFGVMFTPDHRRAAAELARVCRPGGRIGLANWTPDGFIGELFRLVGRYVPPPAGVASPALWGSQDHLERILGDVVASMDITTKEFVFRYQTPDHFIDVFRAFYGPTHKAFAALDGVKGAQLAAEMDELLQRYDRGRGNGLVVPAAYAEIVAVRR